MKITKKEPIYLIYNFEGEDGQSIDISDFFENNFFLTYELIKKILERERLEFDPKRIELYSFDKEEFIKINKDFKMDVNPEKPNSISIQIYPKMRKSSGNMHNQEMERISADLRFLKDLILGHIKEFHDFRDKFEMFCFQVSSQNLVKTQLSSQLSTYPEQENPIALINIQGEEKANEIYLKKNESNVKKKTIDLMILYSDPLVKIKNDRPQPMNDPVGYEQECMTLSKMLKELEREITIKIDIATLVNLNKILSEPPIILHFICHGDFSPQKQKYYLDFENENAELEECDSGKIANLLKIRHDNTNQIKLVFVNACHSEEVGQVFIEAGVPCVIAIQSELQIEDKVAQKFSESFYRDIFSGNSIESAFMNAQLVAQTVTGDRSVYTCCCAHNHTPNCQWHEQAMDNTYEILHEAHVPQCKCPKNYQHIHKYNCPWALNFQENFNLGDDDDEELGENPNKVERGEIFVCCCCKTKPHNESLKFKMMVKDPNSNYQQMCLFENKSKGTLEDKSLWEVGESPIRGAKVIGRNLEIHKIFSSLKQKIRFLQVSGESGVGKTSIVQQAANYMYERRLFKDVLPIIDIQRVQLTQGFLTKLRSKYFYEDHFIRDYANKKALIILDNCDLLLDKDGITFCQKLNELALKMKYVKFILITKTIKKLSLDKAQVQNILISVLDAKKSVDLLLQHAGEEFQLKYQDKNELINHDIFKLKSFVRTPKNIMALAQACWEKQDLNSIYNMYKNAMESSDATSTSAFDLALTNIKNKSDLAYDLILLLSQFSSGLFFLDLEIMIALGFTSSNAIELLKILTKFKEESDEMQNSIGLKLTRKPSQIDPNQEINIEPNSYFWFNVEREKKDEKNETLAIKINHFLTNYLETNTNHKRNLQSSLIAYRYLAYLSIQIIEGFKSRNKLLEKIVECSGVSEEGIWSIYEDMASSASFFPLNPLNSYKCLGQLKSNLSQRFDNLSPAKIFEKHKQNFFDCFELPKIMDTLALIQKDKSSKELFHQIFESLSILTRNVPTILKVLGHSDETREVIESILIMCTKLQQNEYRNSEFILNVQRMEIMMKMIMASLLFERAFGKYGEESSFENLRDHLHTLEKDSADLHSKSQQDWILYELSLLKCSIFFENRVKLYNIDNICSDRESNLKMAMALIKQTIEKLTNHVGDEKFIIFHDKLTLLEGLIKVELKKTNQKPLKSHSEDAFSRESSLSLTPTELRLSNSEMDFNYFHSSRDNFLDDLKEVCQNFRRKNLKMLEVIANNCLAELCLGIVAEKGIDSEKESLLMDLKNTFVERSISISKEIEDIILSRESKNLLDRLNIELRRVYSHVFIFMKAYPLVEEKFENKSSKLIQAGQMTKLASNFRRRIVNNIEKKSRKITLKFEILTYKNLLETFRKGGKILHISLDIDNEDNLILEDGMCLVEKVPLNTLEKDLIEIKKKKGLMMDIIIIGCLQGEKLANMFHKSLCIPYVFFFDFRADLNFVARHLQELSIDEFSIQLYMKIVDFENGKRSFETSMSKMFERIGNLSSNIKLHQDFDKYLGKPKYLYLDKEIRLEDPMIESSTLPLGKLIDISSLRGQTNIEKFDKPLIGRNVDIFVIMKQIRSDIPERRARVNLYGESGVGKTTLAKIIGYFLYSRNFFEDGVFYTSLKRSQNKSNDMWECLREILGDKLMTERVYYFNNKHVLFIFDEFDEAVKLGMRHLDNILIDGMIANNIPFILITKKQMSKSQVDRYHINFIHKLHPLSPQESQDLLTSCHFFQTNFEGKQSDPKFTFPINLEQLDPLFKPILRREKYQPGFLLKQYKESKEISEFMKLNQTADSKKDHNKKNRAKTQSANTLSINIKNFDDKFRTSPSPIHLTSSHSSQIFSSSSNNQNNKNGKKRDSQLIMSTPNHRLSNPGHDLMNWHQRKTISLENGSDQKQTSFTSDGNSASDHRGQNLFIDNTFSSPAKSGAKSNPKLFKFKVTEDLNERNESNEEPIEDEKEDVPKTEPSNNILAEMGISSINTDSEDNDSNHSSSDNEEEGGDNDNEGEMENLNNISKISRNKEGQKLSDDSKNYGNSEGVIKKSDSICSTKSKNSKKGKVKKVKKVEKFKKKTQRKYNSRGKKEEDDNKDVDSSRGSSKNSKLILDNNKF